MKRLEQIVAIFIAAGLAIPSYWFFWTLAGGGGYDRRVKPSSSSFLDNSSLQTPSNFNKP
tara:strand:- start:36096 stop:36275 length:180 start_codon:yes stop_codon:yes gene_type:complete